MCVRHELVESLLLHMTVNHAVLERPSLAFRAEVNVIFRSKDSRVFISIPRVFLSMVSVYSHTLTCDRARVRRFSGATVIDMPRSGVLKASSRMVAVFCDLGTCFAMSSVLNQRRIAEGITF